MEKWKWKSGNGKVKIIPKVEIVSGNRIVEIIPKVVIDNKKRKI